MEKCWNHAEISRKLIEANEHLNLCEMTIYKLLISSDPIFNCPIKLSKGDGNQNSMKIKSVNGK